MVCKSQSYNATMTSPFVHRHITSRIIRKGDPQPEEQEWANTTPEERMNAVWELTRLRMAWQLDQTDEP